MFKGRFITLEGSEGAGKSSNVKAICECLDQHKIDYYSTREPGGTELAESLRELMLANWRETIDPLTELLVFFAARNQHIANEIIPRLEKGQWVVCDRFTDATYAYQGHGRGLNLDYITTIEEWVQKSLQPDLTLYLDLDPTIGAERIANREKDRMEREQIAFYQAVREGYLSRAKTFSRIKTIDASLALDEVGAAVTQTLAKFVQENTARLVKP